MKWMWNPCIHFMVSVTTGWFCHWSLALVSKDIEVGLFFSVFNIATFKLKKSWWNLKQVALNPNDGLCTFTDTHQRAPGSEQVVDQLHYFTFNTFTAVHCTLRHEVLLMQTINRRIAEKCNAPINEMHVYENLQSHLKGKLY